MHLWRVHNNCICQFKFQSGLKSNRIRKQKIISNWPWQSTGGKWEEMNSLKTCSVAINTEVKMTFKETTINMHLPTPNWHLNGTDLSLMKFQGVLHHWYVMCPLNLKHEHNQWCQTFLVWHELSYIMQEGMSGYWPTWGSEAGVDGIVQSCIWKILCRWQAQDFCLLQNKGFFWCYCRSHPYSTTKRQN